MSSGKLVATSIVFVFACGGSDPPPAPPGVPINPPQPVEGGLFEAMTNATATGDGTTPTPPVAKEPVKLADGQRDPDHIAVDDSGVYWLTTKAVMKVGRDGGTPTELAPAKGGGNALLLDGDSLYALTWDGGIKVPKKGGAPEKLPKGVKPAALDAANFYWMGVETGPKTIEGRSGTIESAPRAGGPSRTLAKGQFSPKQIAVDASGVYWVCAGTSGNGYADGFVLGTKPAGGKPFFNVDKLLTSNAHSILTDAENVYWLSDGEVGKDNGALVKAAKSGGAPTVLAQGITFAAQDFAADVAAVYWVSTGKKGTSTGAVWRVAKSGGTPTAVVTNRSFPYSITVDEKWIYWTEMADAGTGTVWRIAK